MSAFKNPYKLPNRLYGEWGSTTAIRIALIGDSTLDNGYWVHKDESSVSEQIFKMQNSFYGESIAVYNLAVDGFTTSSCLNERSFFPFSRKKNMDRFYPMEGLKVLDPPPTHIILSVGGNDVREVLGSGQKKALPNAVKKLQQNYLLIVNQCLSVCENTILMFQYRPSFNMNNYGIYESVNFLQENEIRKMGLLESVSWRSMSSVTFGGFFHDNSSLEDDESNASVRKLNALIETIYNGLLTSELFRTKTFQIIDLPNTFYIYCNLLYEHQIEPSHCGGLVIAKIVCHMICNRNRMEHLLENCSGTNTDKQHIFYSLDINKFEIFTQTSSGTKKKKREELTNMIQSSDVVEEIFKTNNKWKVVK